MGQRPHVVDQDFEWPRELGRTLPVWVSPLGSGGWSEHLLLFCVALQFEMLTGSLPFQGKDRKETMALILK